VKSTTSLRLLLLAAIATPLLAFWPQDQEPANVNWATHVDKACTSQRYGLRLAAARKVAGGGSAAVPALRAWAERHGRNALPASLVDAIADADGTAPGVLDLLREWAEDRDFYWRSSALRGLAQRAPAAPRDEQLHELFMKYRNDPAWLMRSYARFGASLLGVDDIVLLPEPDPRARVRLAALLLDAGRTPPLQPLFDALADERTFLGDPWGQRMGAEAHKALKNWLGDAHPLADGGTFDDKVEAIRTLLAAAEQKSGQDLTMPEPRRDDAAAPKDGLQILSCKNGDLFVAWDDQGIVRIGIEASPRVHLPEATWQQLSRDRTRWALPDDLGVVICDNLQLRFAEPELHVRIAPGSLPADVHAWLKQLASALEEAGVQRVADELRTGIQQFAGT
jgi:hypothetical protein